MRGRVVAAVSLLASAMLWVGPANAGPSGTLTLTPNVALVDFQPVVLTGVGLEPGLHEWYQCRGGAVDESDCDGYNADFISVEPDGTTTETIYVDARIYLPDGTEVDCRTDPAGCVIGVGFMLDAGQWPTVPLNFDPTASLRPPVSATVEPSTGLADDQVVIVHGEHLSFREEAFAYLCTEGVGEVGARCDIDRSARTVPDQDGSATLELDVRSTFTTPLGPVVDCRAAATRCFVVLGWGFDPPPDRQAHVAVSFAPPSVAPPPPTPVPAQATFTG